MHQSGTLPTDTYILFIHIFLSKKKVDYNAMCVKKEKKERKESSTGRNYFL